MTHTSARNRSPVGQSVLVAVPGKEDDRLNRIKSLGLENNILIEGKDRNKKLLKLLDAIGLPAR